jgi:uncharacterized membrane protein YvbJ
MRTCPTCGHAIDDVRLPCPNCGKPIIRAGILASNVGLESEAPPPSKRPNLVVPLVLLVSLVVLAVVIVFLVVSSQPGPVPAATVASVREDFDALVQRADEIRRDDLLVLRLRY